MKKTIAFLLVCVLLFGVCGCRINPNPTPPAVLAENTAYTRHYMTASVPGEAIVKGETIKLTAENTVKFVYERRSNNDLQTLVFCEIDPVSQAQRTIQELSYEYSSGYPEAVLFADGIVNQSTLWYKEFVEGDTMYGGTTPDRYALCAVDNATGQSRYRWILSDAWQGTYTLLADSNDTVYIVMETYVPERACFVARANAATGELSDPHKIEGTKEVSCVLTLNDGRIAIVNQEAGMVIPFAKGSVTPETPFPLPADVGADCFFDGAGNQPFLLLMGTVLYGADGTPLIDLAAWGATFDMATLRDLTLQDGVCRVLLEEKDSLGVYTLTPCTSEEAAPTLHIAGYYVDEDVHAAVAAFNRMRFDYTARVTDYRQFDDNPNSPYLGGAGVTKMNTELLAGGDFDVLYLNDYLSSAALIKQGALLDLYPLLDGGGAITRETFVPIVLDKTETDGHLYSLSAAFGVRTMVGDGRVIGERSLLSNADWRALQVAYPDAEVTDMVQDTYLICLADVALHDFITGNTARFDTGDFAACLETLKTLDTLDERMEELMDPASTATYTSLAEGRFLLMPLLHLTVGGYQEVLCQLEGNAQFTGFPCENGAGHVMEFDNTLGIFADTDKQKAAWDFVQFFLQREIEPTGVNAMMSTNRAAFEDDLMYFRDSANFVDENGEPRKTSGGKPLYALDDGDVERLYALIVDAKPIVATDRAIYEIVESEIAVFLHGEATAEETAARVQSRVQIYLNEQG